MVKLSFPVYAQFLTKLSEEQSAALPVGARAAAGGGVGAGIGALIHHLGKSPTGEGSGVKVSSTALQRFVDRHARLPRYANLGYLDGLRDPTRGMREVANARQKQPFGIDLTREIPAVSRKTEQLNRVLTEGGTRLEGRRTYRAGATNSYGESHAYRVSPDNPEALSRSRGLGTRLTEAEWDRTLPNGIPDIDKQWARGSFEETMGRRTPRLPG